MREWFTSNELLGLAGMPNSLTGVAQKARRNKWLSRKASGQGRAFEYHISNFHEEVIRQLFERENPGVSYDETQEELAKKLEALAEFTESIRDEQKNSTSSATNVTEISNVKLVKATSEIGDMCAVPVYNVYASCGFGTQNDSEYQLRTEFLPCLWLRRFGLTEEDARIIICHGDSMEDTLSDGDEVLVDTRELDHPVKHGVYVVRIGKHVYIKRLKYDIMAEGYNVISDNKEEYDSFIVNEEKLNEFAVIGKVVTTVMKAVI
ncbi:helix-turn-helix domain-containing protein [Vibrio sp. Vb339]|uniref:helix-turn-helix domain-containing protein n=1 Tax=Vibrio sp. Vb339 TaxID=1192013 RepID=UPI0015528A60|nr:S24 family peptidase [Vibrio sp. Vb339]